MNFTPTAAATTESFEWMLVLGIDWADVIWLETLCGTVELHLPGNIERVDRIWKKAITAILTSSSPARHLAQALK
jgi:hypothetical protein